MDTRVWDISRVFHPFNYKKIYPFISKVNPDPSYLSDILLYGSKSLEDAENKAMREATIQFIADTGRLQPLSKG